jgi:transposase-like protein
MEINVHSLTYKQVTKLNSTMDRIDDAYRCKNCGKEFTSVMEASMEACIAKP